MKYIKRLWSGIEDMGTIGVSIIVSIIFGFAFMAIACICIRENASSVQLSIRPDDSPQASITAEITGLSKDNNGVFWATVDKASIKTSGKESGSTAKVMKELESTGRAHISAINTDNVSVSDTDENSVRIDIYNSLTANGEYVSATVSQDLYNKIMNEKYGDMLWERK